MGEKFEGWSQEDSGGTDAGEGRCSAKRLRQVGPAALRHLHPAPYIPGSYSLQPRSPGALTIVISCVLAVSQPCQHPAILPFHDLNSCILGLPISPSHYPNSRTQQLQSPYQPTSQHSVDIICNAADCVTRVVCQSDQQLVRSRAS